MGSSKEDVPIQHTREQEVVWFYATVLLAPALVLGVGSRVRLRGEDEALATEAVEVTSGWGNL